VDLRSVLDWDSLLLNWPLITETENIIASGSDALHYMQYSYILRRFRFQAACFELIKGKQLSRRTCQWPTKPLSTKCVTDGFVHITYELGCGLLSCSFRKFFLGVASRAWFNFMKFNLQNFSILQVTFAEETWQQLRRMNLIGATLLTWIVSWHQMKLWSETSFMIIVKRN